MEEVSSLGPAEAHPPKTRPPYGDRLPGSRCLNIESIAKTIFDETAAGRITLALTVTNVRFLNQTKPVSNEWVRRYGAKVLSAEASKFLGSLGTIRQTGSQKVTGLAGLDFNIVNFSGQHLQLSVDPGGISDEFIATLRQYLSPEHLSARLSSHLSDVQIWFERDGIRTLRITLRQKIGDQEVGDELVEVVSILRWGKRLPEFERVSKSVTDLSRLYFELMLEHSRQAFVSSQIKSTSIH